MTCLAVCVCSTHLTPSRHRSSRPGVRWRRHGERMEQGMGSRGERASRCWDCFFFKRKFLLTSFIDWEHVCVRACVQKFLKHKASNCFQRFPHWDQLGDYPIFMHIDKCVLLSCKYKPPLCTQTLSLMLLCRAQTQKRGKVKNGTVCQWLLRSLAQITIRIRQTNPSRR